VRKKKAFQCTRDPSAETGPDPYLGLGFVCHPEEVVVVDAELTKGHITETAFVIRGLQSDGLVGLTSKAPNLTGLSPTPILPVVAFITLRYKKRNEVGGTYAKVHRDLPPTSTLPLIRSLRHSSGGKTPHRAVIALESRLTSDLHLLLELLGLAHRKFQ
jgi:hypothetical protein